jgi:hypothetical protein
MHSNHVEMANKITGAAKVEKVIGVEPCKKCYGKALEPLRALQSAIDAARQM